MGTAPFLNEFHADHGGSLPVRVVGYSAQISLVVSSAFFALTTIDLRPTVAAWVVRRWTMLAVIAAVPIVAYGAVALGRPELLGWIPVRSDTLRWGLALVSTSCFIFAALRFFQAYRLALLPLQGTMTLSMLLLVEAQWMMRRGPLWHLSWWEYHVVMLVGFLLPVGALLVQYRRTGDLGAIWEGLFLRQHVQGIRSGDPKALLALTAAVAAKDTETVST